MKVVSLNHTAEEVKPQESPFIWTNVPVTKSPPTPPLPRQLQDEKRLGKVGRTAVHQNPEVRKTPNITAKWRLLQ